MTKYIKEEARQICKDLFEQMAKIDTQDRFSLEVDNYGFRIEKGNPNNYSIDIAGDGIHYSKSLKGLRLHLLKKIEQVITAARMKEYSEMRQKQMRSFKL